MFTNSWPTSMSKQPVGGHGLLCSMSQMPDKSGLPSTVRGAGADRLGRPSDVFGTPAVGYVSHCAETVRGTETATRSADAVANTLVTSLTVTSRLEERGFERYFCVPAADSLRNSLRPSANVRSRPTALWVPSLA